MLGHAFSCGLRRVQPEVLLLAKDGGIAEQPTTFMLPMLFDNACSLFQGLSGSSSRSSRRKSPVTPLNARKQNPPASTLKQKEANGQDADMQNPCDGVGWLGWRGSRGLRCGLQSRGAPGVCLSRSTLAWFRGVGAGNREMKFKPH
jgi:hypothetical protein